LIATAHFPKGHAMSRDERNARRELKGKPPAVADAAGQFGEAQASPNPSGVVSANPTVLSGDGDATSGEGHGRDRNGQARPNRKSNEAEGQRLDDLPFAGTPGGAKR
jgi:hypothetical protein